MKKITTVIDGGTIEERIRETKEFLGMNPDQTFQDLEMEANTDFICDDRPIETPDRIKNMTAEETEIEYQKRFGEFLKDIDQ